MIAGFPDLEALQSRAAVLLHDKGLSPKDQHVLAVDFVQKLCGAVVRNQFPDDGAYEKAFLAFVRHCKGSGLPGIKANAIVMAWTLKLLQDSEIVPMPESLR